MTAPNGGKQQTAAAPLAIRIRGCISPVTTLHVRLHRDEDGRSTERRTMLALLGLQWQLVAALATGMGTYRLLCWPVLLASLSLCLLFCIIINDNLVDSFCIAVLEWLRET